MPEPDVPPFIDMRKLDTYPVETLRYYRADLAAVVEANQRRRRMMLTMPVAIIAMAWISVWAIDVAAAALWGRPVVAGAFPVETIAWLVTGIAIVALSAIFTFTPGTEAHVAESHLRRVTAALARR